MGREEGTFESWVYPMKIVRDLRLSFDVEGYSYPLAAADLAEWITVRPECTTITFSHPAFVARANVLTPIDEPGSLILLDVDSSRKVSVTVSFLIDLVPMWPAGLGGQYSVWDQAAKAFVLTESTRRNSALVGSPAATRYSAQPAHNLPDSRTQFHIEVDAEYARRNFLPIVIAGGLDTPARVQEVYLRLLTGARSLYEKNVQHFSQVRNDFVSLQSPDVDLDQAVEWAKVALDTGYVCNPQLGCGQIAGLGLSGTTSRPGFGWFFGGDTFINAFAVSSAGDLATLREELAFLRGNQRADGKMMHELSQAGGMIPWFSQYPYGYYHGDTTPLYLIAVENYLRHSGDIDFVKESWGSLQNAYKYCLSTDPDGDGLMDNAKAGLGAVETGALLDRSSTDIYLAGVSTAAHRAMARMATVMGQREFAMQADGSFQKASKNLNQKFWNAEQQLLAFALTEGGGKSNEITIWPAVAIALELIQPEYAGRMLAHLAGAAVSTDWGGRMLIGSSKVYDPISYNNGSVWPFLNGLLGWAEYRYHRPLAAFSRWIQNARLTYIHALGYVPELVSGDFYQPLDTAVPHQLFSSAGVITPFVKGMLGFEPASHEKSVRLQPHFPARWTDAEARKLRVGAGEMTVNYRRLPQEAVYRITSARLEGFRLDFLPGLEPGAQIRRVLLNGKPIAYEPILGDDVHCSMALPLTGNDEIRIELQPGLRLLEPEAAPSTGDRSSLLKIVELQWDRVAETYTLRAEGRSGRRYGLQARTPHRPVAIDGATWSGSDTEGVLSIEFPPGDAEYSSKSVKISMR
jgi:glycogen debranching enzyme